VPETALPFRWARWRALSDELSARLRGGKSTLLMGVLVIEQAKAAGS